jgi:transposase-like protein
VSDSERDAAWKRIRSAARKYGVHIEARGWRQLMKGGRSGRKSSRKYRHPSEAASVAPCGATPRPAVV